MADSMARADHRKHAVQLRTALSAMGGLLAEHDCLVLDDMERCADELEEAAERAARLLAEGSR